MKTINIRIIVPAFILLAAASCSQDPIFYIISRETALQKPLVQGSPTNIVVFEREYPLVSEPETEGEPEPEPVLTARVPIMFVASGRIHWYAKSELGAGDSRWNADEYKIVQPGGRIIALAATNEHLYALCMTGHGVNTNLKRLGHDGTETEWEEIVSEVANYPFIQSIYADPSVNRLFAGARINNKERSEFAFLYLADDSTLKLLKDETSMISGAVYRDDGFHYLSSIGSGIFQISEADLAAGTTTGILQLEDVSDLKDSDKHNNRTIMGIIKLEDAAQTIIAVERNGGAFYDVQNGSLARIQYSGENSTWIETGKLATGVLALWTNGSRDVLVAGIQGGLYNTVSSSYTHGYVEFDLDSAGSLDITVPRRDPGRLVTVEDNDRYTATIGKHPLNDLFQAPLSVDDNMTFFASTQNAGLWSYRDRPKIGGLQWNAETRAR